VGLSSEHVRGVALVAAATVLWSTAAVYVRLLDLDVWAIQAWRSLFGALSLFVVIAARHGRATPRAFLSIGWKGLAAVVPSAISMGAYVAALRLTTVANVMVVYATVPLIAAAVAWFWIGERITRRTTIASLVALAGIAVMAGNATQPGDIAGNLLSLLMTLCFAVLLVMARRYPDLPMAPINALGAALVAVLCWPLMPAGFSLAGIPSAGELAIMALFGATTMGLAYLLVLTGGRRIPSSEAALIGLLDVILGPLWVWLGFGERPGSAAVVGGALVLGALVWYLAGGRPPKSSTTGASG